MGRRLCFGRSGGAPPPGKATLDLAMEVNHIILGARVAHESAHFYVTVLGYEIVSAFTDTGTGREGLVLERGFAPQLLVVPFDSARLPSPQHVAFELSADEFEALYRRCEALKLRIRADPPLDSTTNGIGSLDNAGRRYRHFYLLDPGGINLEFMAP